MISLLTIGDETKQIQISNNDNPKEIKEDRQFTKKNSNIMKHTTGELGSIESKKKKEVQLL